MYTILIDTQPSIIRLQNRPVEFGGLALVETGTALVDGAPRRYYAAHPPLRLLLVMQTGNIADLQVGRYVQALLGWDNGDNPYVLDGQQGKRHTKISVTGITAYPSITDEWTPLSEIVAKAPRSDRPGGFRGGDSGRPRLAEDDLTESHNVSLPSRVWRKIEVLGDNNRSAGVRKLADMAGINHKDD
jgi:hypothetical protein